MSASDSYAPLRAQRTVEIERAIYTRDADLHAAEAASEHALERVDQEYAATIEVAAARRHQAIRAILGVRAADVANAWDEYRDAVAAADADYAAARAALRAGER